MLKFIKMKYHKAYLLYYSVLFVVNLVFTMIKKYSANWSQRKKFKNSLGLHFFMSLIFDQRRWKLRQESHAARFIMDASSKASSVRLFDDLSWLPLYEEAKISIYLIAFERPRGEQPAYIYSPFNTY